MCSLTSLIYSFRFLCGKIHIPYNIMKKFILLSLSLLALTCAIAQKSSSESLTIDFTIDPAMQLPRDIWKYKTKLVTPINPLTAKEEENAVKGQKSDDAKT